MNLKKSELDYLKLLAKQYPTLKDVGIKIASSLPSLYLPKATEHFVSDIHGEHIAFGHVLRSSSGLIRRLVDKHFPHTLLKKRGTT